VTDAEFADALAAAENDLIDAYVQGELTGVVLQQFKSHYLASSRRRAKVEFAQAIQHLAEKDEAAAEYLGLSQPKRNVSDRSPGPRLFELPRLMPQWSFAVAALAFALVLAGGWLFFENTRTARREPSIATFVLTPQTRDAGQIRTISIPANTDYVDMNLELEPNDDSFYRVELLDSSAKQSLWRSDRLTSRTTNNIPVATVRFSARLLKPRTYLFRVTGIPANGVPEVVGDYPFTVAK
jgi:hypothetical protein